jgi:histidyl-tRNA synthetase
LVEAEICAAASDVLMSLGFSDFTIRLNHRKVLSGLLETLDVPAEKHSDTLIAIDKLDKIGPEGLEKELEAIGLSQSAIEGVREIFQFVRKQYDAEGDDSWNAVIFATLSQQFKNHDQESNGLDDLRGILNYCAATSAGSHIKIDPSLARGLSYYTGAIIEINVPDLAGSLGGGGRYDNLVGMFLGEDVPACGFSLGLERIIVVMTERGMFPPDILSAPAEVMVTIWNEESIIDSVALAHGLRRAGLRVDLYPEADKVGKQFKYASARGIQFVAVIGDDERARGEVAVKDMRTGEQRSVKSEDVATAIRNWGS